MRRAAAALFTLFLVASFDGPARSSPPPAAPPKGPPAPRPTPAEARPEQPSPDEALTRLLDGNKRFLANRLTQVSSDHTAARSALAASQSPFAVILTCSDSRVSPELLFDQGLGQLFVVRVAGNVTDPVVLGSIEYAAEHLHSPLVLVLGHERCGAVKATVDGGGKAEGHIGALVSAIAPALTAAEKSCAACQAKAGRPGESCAKAHHDELVECVVAENARRVAGLLVDQSPILQELVGKGALKIVPARYDLDEGAVTRL